MKYILEMYQDKSKGPRWRLTRGKKTLCDSGENYASKWKLRRAVNKLLEHVFKRDVIHVVDMLDE